MNRIPSELIESTIPDEPLFMLEFAEHEIGLEGFVCIHTMGRNGASGGMRCVPDIDKEEVRLLARAMTYKYSFFRIEQGGAKAGLRLSYEEEPARRKLLLASAARHLEPLVRKNLWSPWSDMNFSGADLAEFYRAIGLGLHAPVEGGSSFRTAVSAFAALQACVDHLAVDPHRVRVSIEGFGSVARYLAPFLNSYGVKVVALTTLAGGVWNPEGLDLDAILAHLKERRGGWERVGNGWKPITIDQLFDIETDIFIPCARVHSIGADRAQRLPTRLVVPIANVPCTEQALAILDRRGITYVPDFVANGGGVCGHVLAGACPENVETTRPFIRCFGAMVLRMLRAAEAQRISPRKLAEQVAHENFALVRSGVYEGTTLSRRLLHRIGASRLVPHSAVDHLLGRGHRTISHINGIFS
jgi:glutamate dehydrogenase/leucine dehydrogenase